MKIIALIPANGEVIGSQKRNLALIDGIPLLKFTIDYAKKCKEISKIVVLTNDMEIYKFSKENGADVITLPDQLSAKGTVIKNVLRYAIEVLKQKENYIPDLAVFLEATHPFRGKEWLENMIKLVAENMCDQIFISKAEKDNFWKFNEYGDLEFLGKEQDSVREKKQPIYKEMAGLGSVMKTEVLMSDERLGKNVGMVPISGIYSVVDIKTEEDLFIAEQIYKRYFKKNNYME